jgi:hypothetical protein
MRWLPWLEIDQRELVSSRIRETVASEIYTRHWGAPAPGQSPGRIPRFYIMDIRGLFMAAGILRYTLGQLGTSVFYRGQRKDWEAQVALFRGTTTRVEARERERWLEAALVEAGRVFDPPGTPDAREALLQHYGLPTRWLDVVDNAQTAAWFAYHHSVADDPGAPGERDDASGYISAIACPTDGAKYARAFDLRAKPSEWLRPHIQQAWAVRAMTPTSGLGRLYYLQICTFIVPRSLLRQWSAYDVFTPAVLFPRENEDRGVYYWRRARQALTTAGLYPPPWSIGVV